MFAPLRTKARPVLAGLAPIERYRLTKAFSSHSSGGYRLLSLRIDTGTRSSGPCPTHSFRTALSQSKSESWGGSKNPSRSNSTTSQPTTRDKARSQVPLPDPKKLRQRLTLPNSQHIFFDEYGREEGIPVISLHGFPCTGSENFGFHSLAWKYGIRLICPDRPGMGLSSPWPSDRLTTDMDLLPDFYPIHEYPKQIAALAYHLGLDKFGVLGGSGGGPYALSCANSLQKKINEYTEDDLKRLSHSGMNYRSGHHENAGNDDDKSTPKMLSSKPQLTAVGVFAGAGPYAIVGSKGLSVAGRLIWELVARSKFVGRLLATYFRRLSHRDGGKAMENSLRQQLKWLRKEDRKALGGEDAIQTMVFLFANGMHQEWGFWTEARALVARKGWGFDLNKIDFTAADEGGVRLWYGGQDRNTPAEHGRQMARMIPKASIKVYENVSHFTTENVMLDDVILGMLQAMGEKVEIIECEKASEEYTLKVLQMLKEIEKGAGRF